MKRSDHEEGNSANFYWNVINSKYQKSYSTKSIMMHHIYCTIQTKNCTPSVEGKIERRQTFIKSNEPGAIQFKILLIHTRVTREGNYKQYVKWCTFETTYQSWKNYSVVLTRKSQNVHQQFWSYNKKTLRILQYTLYIKETKLFESKSTVTDHLTFYFSNSE